MKPGMVAHCCAALKRVRVMASTSQWLLLCALLLISVTSVAQTRVGGAIAVDTRWSAAASPYLIEADLIIQNGATLEIEAGTDVHVAAGVAAHVQSGTLKAIGRRGAPIRVLSAKSLWDASGAPGDFKPWAFNTGARNVHLEHMVFQHGSGLEVRGASLRLENVSVLDNAGAAITADLASSLTGTGNLARGNGIDGVLLPSGDVTTSITWGLRGIPYVLQSGAVSVGQSPTLDRLLPATLQAGESVTVEVTGKRLGGLTSARAAKPGITVQVAPGSTATTARLQVTAAADAEPGVAALSLLTDAGIADGPATLRVLAPQPTILALEPAQVYVGQGTVKVDVIGRGFTGETKVLLNTVVQPTEWLDSTRLRVGITTQGALANLAVRLRSPDPAAAGQFLLSNEVALPVQAAQIRITPSPAEVIRGVATRFTVALPYALSVDATVTLVSSVPGVANVPGSLLVTAGETSASFELTAAATGTTVITASRSGMVSGQSTVSVVLPPSLRLSPQELLLGAGRTTELELVASKAAPAGGLSVQLRSSDTSVASVPQTAILAAGATTLKVPLTSHALGVATITASADNHVEGQSTVSVRPVSLNLPSATVVAPGLARSIPLTLSDPAPAGGLTVQLRSSNTAVATVPASVQVAAGETVANFVLSGVSAGSVRIDATAPGYEAGQLSASIESIAIGLGEAGTSVALPKGEVMTYPVRLSRPAPAGGVTVTLAIVDPSLASVQPQEVRIAEGETSASSVITVTGLQVGTSELVASSPGLASATVQLQIQQQAQLDFLRTTQVVGKGLKTYQYEMYVYRRVGSNHYSPQRAVEVSLRSSNPAFVRVPERVTIPAGTYYAYFQVEGVEVTGSEVVTIEATHTSYLAAPAPLKVSTVMPQFQLASIDTRRSPSSARDDVYIQLVVPGANYANNQVAARDTRVDLAIEQATPVGIVRGFHGTPSSDESIEAITLRADNSTSGWFYIGTPMTTGSYAARASSTGLGSTVSAPVTVSAPELRFSRSSVVVGKGAMNYQYELLVQRYVDGAIFNGADPLTVTLTSNDGKSLASSVTIPAGQSQAYIQVTGIELTSTTPSILDASAPGYTSPPTKLAVSVVAPSFRFESLDTKRSPASTRDDMYVQLHVEGAMYPTLASAARETFVDLAIVDAAPSGIIDGIYTAASGGAPVPRAVIAAGSQSSGWLYVGQPTSPGTYRIKGSNPDLGTGTSPAVAVTAPQLAFSRTATVVGKGLSPYLYEVGVQRMVDGVAFNGTDALTVTISSSDPSRAVAGEVVIPAGQSIGYVRVVGVDLTSGSAVKLVASAAGYVSTSVPLQVSVVQPRFQFSALDTSRTPASARDDFYLETYVDGSTYPTLQTAAAPLRVALSVVDAQPAGNVSSFHSALTGGAAVDSATIAAGSQYSNTVFVETPRAGGSYKVRATATGIAATDSPTVNVTTPALRFSRPTVVVGKGLANYEYEISVERVAGSATFNGVDPLVVSLRCSAVAVCSVPATVTIPANSSSMRFRVTGVGLGSTTVGASAAGYDSAPEAAVSTVLARPSISLPASLQAGRTADFYVGFHVPGALYPTLNTAMVPFTVNLTSSAPGVATVPMSTTVTAGQANSPYLQFKAQAPGATTVTASGTDLESTTTTPITVTP